MAVKVKSSKSKKSISKEFFKNIFEGKFRHIIFITTKHTKTRHCGILMFSAACRAISLHSVRNIPLLIRC
jgi:hypothetical protein